MAFEEAITYIGMSLGAAFSGAAVANEWRLRASRLAQKMCQE